MNLALAVLSDANRGARDEDVCTSSARLSTGVLRPYLPDDELLVTFWTAAASGRGKPHGPPLQPMRWIVTRLVDAGHPAWMECR
ncbi:hypothetical protein [Sphingomonas sp. DT-51]|uniref:hypothetical protein n=1 Tax=Sphingomonas sp. DT-51 TaxID=3396165 RepID=UPI003F540CF7